MCVCVTCVVTYVVKGSASYRGALGQLMGVARKRTHV